MARGVIFLPETLVIALLSETTLPVPMAAMSDIPPFIMATIQPLVSIHLMVWRCLTMSYGEPHTPVSKLEEMGIRCLITWPC